MPMLLEASQELLDALWAYFKVRERHEAQPDDHGPDEEPSTTEELRAKEVAVEAALMEFVREETERS
jgi:hypothetical protein